MPSNWSLHPVSEVAEVTDYVANGSFAALRENVEYLKERDYAILVRLVDFKSGWTGPFVYVSEESFRFLKKSSLVADDIVISNVGAYAGTIFRAPNLGMPMTLGPNAIVVKPRQNRRFLYYYFSSPTGQQQVRSIITGSAQPKFNKTDFRKIKVLMPPPEEQRAIAQVLGTLDDKIELNRRMNETLEAMARAIFKSWFVDFDPVKRNQDRKRGETATSSGALAKEDSLFPTSFQNSPLGKIPASWRCGTLNEVGENPRRGVKPNDISPETPYIGLEHVPKKNIALTEWGKAEDVDSNKFQFKQGEILFGKLRPYFHKVGVAPVNGVCSTDILVLAARSKDWFGFLLAHVSSEEFISYTDAASTGTKMPRTNWRDMARYEVVIPDHRVAKSYNDIATPMIGRIDANIMQSRTLAAIRDTLLPKLISGEIRAKDAGRIIGRKTEVV